VQKPRSRLTSSGDVTFERTPCERSWAKLAQGGGSWLDLRVVVSPSPPWAEALEARARSIADGGLLPARHLLHWTSEHTGLPVIVVAALASVLAWRVARRTWHIALELGLALAVLLVATKLGWIRW
jgi:hypothetical protein